MCDLLRTGFFVSFFIFAPVGILLTSFVQHRLIKSYGWGVFFRYSAWDIYGPLLSKRERVLFRCGLALTLTPFLSLAFLALTRCVRSGP